MTIAIITHYLAAGIGAVVGFTVAAFLAVGRRADG